MVNIRFRPRTWDDVKTLDDCVIPEEKRILVDIEGKAKRNKLHICSELGKEGEFFYYCKKEYVPNAKDKIPTPMSQIYKRHVESAVIQLYCFGRCKSCCFYNGKLKR